MFLKKSLLFMTALALLMFAGQASAQLSLSLGEGGSSMVSGSGTEISVDVSQTGVTASVFAVEIMFDIDTSVINLTGAPPGFLLSGGNTASLLQITPSPVPTNASFTFTTVADVTGMEFSIGIGSISVDGNALPFPAPGALAFNGLEAALMSDGEISDAGELMVNVAVPGLMGATAGAEIMFMVDPPGSASIAGVMPAPGLQNAPLEGGMSLTMVGLPPVMLMDGNYGSVTFAVHPDAREFSIGLASLTVFSADGMKRAVGGGDALMLMQSVAYLEASATEVMFEDFGASASASVMAVGFEEGANIRFQITGGTGFATADGAASWTVMTSTPGDVTVVAEDDMGNKTAPLTISFMNPDPYLTADHPDVIIPDGGEVTVSVMATGLGDHINWTVSEVTGTAMVNISTDGATAMLMATDSDDLSQTSTLTLVASDGSMSAMTTVTFRKMPEVMADMAAVNVPQAVVPMGSSMVMAVGFPPDAEVMFHVEVVSGSASDLGEPMQDGHSLTLTAMGTVTVSVMATGGGVTTAAIEVAFTQAMPAAPASVMVQDQVGDNGYYVMVSFSNSENHGDVSQYRVYREMMVNDADGNPMAAWVPWAVIDAMDNDGMTRAVVPVTDAMATRWGVAAESGMGSAEEMIMPAGKRVFTKESVQQLAQYLGLDPNLIVDEDALSEMFMPSADYINSIIGGRENVVFAALDPDVSVLLGGDVNIPQNIRTDGVGPIVSSAITAAEGMVAAMDDTPPAAVTGVAADVETGMITWTASADDMIVGMINYRGYAMPIPGVIGYKVMGGASEDAMIDIGAVPAGATSFQVPQALIESLIDQGLPAVLVTVVALDGTNMTPSVPLVVELVPTRRPFVDANGEPVYIVRLPRHGDTMTPLTVDFEDFVAFTMAFNTDETDENWRVFVQADLNDDKMVNFDDFILFFSSYGKEAQGPAGKSLVTPVLGVNEVAELSLRLGSDRVVAGETMFVDVSLANVQALMGYGFVLHYDADKFEFVEAMPASEDLLLSSGGEVPLLRAWSPEAGQVHVMNAIVNGSEVSGGGDIVRLVFRVLRDFENNARFEIAEGLVFDPSQLANPLAGGVLEIQTTPTEFALLQNFPNPFNPDTTIGYELAESADVTLQIYNVVGQVVRTLIAAEPQSVGRYQVRWDGMDDRGTAVSSGIYFYQISAGKFQDVRKLMLLK